MAINVNTVYNTVLSILNKEQRGYITPAEFNSLAAQVQDEIFQSYFPDGNQVNRLNQNNSQNDTEFFNIFKDISYKLYPFEKEGVLDKKFASLVNKKTCLAIAKKIDLHKYILTFNIKNKKNTIEDKVLADSCEALIGSIYLDKGLNIVEKIILSLNS